MKKYLTFLILLLSFGVSAAHEISPKGTVDKLIAYARNGNGDIYVGLTENGTTCSNGYYIDKASLGYESILSLLLAAYQANTQVTILADVSKRWSGSSHPVCEIYYVAYAR